MHSFHIPVLGVGFSVDAPLKVARYGIDSVMSLVDDTLMEALRQFYLTKFNKEYIPIHSKENDSRAKRITAYLNMINLFVKNQFEALKNSTFEAGSEIIKYLEMLPDYSTLKIKYKTYLENIDSGNSSSLLNFIRQNLKPGSLDVNIMTKVDKANYGVDGNILPNEYNDAHASLRGFAMSDLESSIVFSAGINPKLYSYLATFPDFYPDINSKFKKKIIIKVSDYRSAEIQSKFLAKKGLWVSEFRVESGLNCGGHAFASDGLLLGPILEEFKMKKENLQDSLRAICIKAMAEKNIKINSEELSFRITVQGGVGLASEHEFLIQNYNVDSVGWGSPFLLVPEVMNVDTETLNKLVLAEEEDLYLSYVSPLGVPFNNLRRNEKDIEKMSRVENEKPGSPCIKKFLKSNKEFSEAPICTASIGYIKQKISELKKNFISEAEYNKEFAKIVDKSCLCEGLVATVLKINNIETIKQSMEVAVCPGPNIAYFDKIVSLKEMVDHIYGRANIISTKTRMNLFIKELSLNIDFYKKKIADSIEPWSANTAKMIDTFKNNLYDGINYYKDLFPKIAGIPDETKVKINDDLIALEKKVSCL